MRAPALAALAAALALAPAAAADHRPPCSSRGSQTVAQTATTRVYVKWLDEDRDSGAYYACRFRDNRRRFVGAHDFGGRFEHWRIAGRYVAYVRTDGSSQGTSREVVIRDLRWRRTTAIPAGRSPGLDGIVDFVATARGEVAWIDGGGYGSEPEPRVAAGRAGTTAVAVVDAGPGVEPGSLALSSARDTIYWRRGGGARAARLEDVAPPPAH